MTAVDVTTRELIADCLTRIAAGDARASFDLASVFMGHVEVKDVALNLVVIEALVLIAKAHGNLLANSFLREQWPDMQEILAKRWRRAGFE